MKCRIKSGSGPVEWWSSSGRIEDVRQAPTFDLGMLPAIPDLVFRSTQDYPGRWFAVGDTCPVWEVEPVTEEETASQAASNNLALCVSNLLQVEASAREAITLAGQGAHETAVRQVRCAQAALRYCAARLDQARVQLESLRKDRQHETE
jgi:hypothetical protein